MTLQRIRTWLLGMMAGLCLVAGGGVLFNMGPWWWGPPLADFGVVLLGIGGLIVAFSSMQLGEAVDAMVGSHRIAGRGMGVLLTLALGISSLGVARFVTDESWFVYLFSVGGLLCWIGGGLLVLVLDGIAALSDVVRARRLVWAGLAVAGLAAVLVLVGLPDDTVAGAGFAGAGVLLAWGMGVARQQGTWPALSG